VAVLNRFGAAHIVGADIYAKPRQIAAALGAAQTLAADDIDTIANTDVDVVIEASGSHRGLDLAVTAVTRGGCVAMVGLPPPGPQPVSLATAVTRELELVGSFRFNREIDAVLAALSDGTLTVEGAVTHEFAIEDAQSAFEVASDPATSGKVLLRF
jgi:L-iditol 2-dehydrogenase/L-idonate 5-dehydrogenase